MSERVNGHTNGRRLESHPISSPRAFGSGELINAILGAQTILIWIFGHYVSIVCLFDFLYVSVNSYGQVGTVSSPNTTFFPGQA